MTSIGILEHYLYTAMFNKLAIIDSNLASVLPSVELDQT